MELKWKKVKGSTRPTELDTSSSGYYVYLRRNIQEVEIPVDSMMGEIPEGYPTTQFEYEEARVTQLDYIQNLNLLDTEKVMQNISDQELSFQEELMERDERLESLAQSLSELELIVMENSL